MKNPVTKKNDECAVYEWLKKKSGEVTIEEMFAAFPNVKAEDMAKGFNLFIEEASVGSDWVK